MYSSGYAQQKCKSRMKITSAGCKRGLREPLNRASSPADKMPELPVLRSTDSCSVPVPNKLSDSNGIGLNTVPCKHTNQWIVDIKLSSKIKTTALKEILKFKKESKLIEVEYEDFSIGLLRLIIAEMLRRNCVGIRQSLEINSESGTEMLDMN